MLIYQQELLIIINKSSHTNNRNKISTIDANKISINKYITIIYTF